MRKDVLFIFQGLCLVCSMVSLNEKAVVYPEKLKSGDKVRVIAPSRSLKLISQEVSDKATFRFKDLNLELSFGDHVRQMDEFCSSSVESRVKDLHDAFKDPAIKAIITVIGGFNANQLLDEIDWELIKQNPKIFCGFSDITALSNAMLAKADLVSYSGPHYSTFGQKLHFDYTLKHFIKTLMTDGEYTIDPSEEWSDDRWYANQEDRTLMKNEGFLPINEGECEGNIIGGNITALASLKGTQYFPKMREAVLFLEDDEEVLPHHFDRLLCSVVQLPSFENVKGIVIGRFQKASQMSQENLLKIIKTKKKLSHLPILANVDFGHTDPKITFPIGGRVKLKVGKEGASLCIKKH